MTLVIGLRCTDGLVMAADSQATESEPGGGPAITKRETAKKITIRRELMWGCSGALGVRQAVDEYIEGHYGGIYKGNPTAVELRQRLVGGIQPIVTKHYTWVAQAMGGRQDKLPRVNFIFGTYLRKGAFALISVEWNMAGEVIQAAYCAIGSGMKTATALLGRLRNQEWDLRTALAVAYRTMNDAIHVEPSGIGHPICLAVASLDGGDKVTFRRIRPETPQYKEVKDTARVWMGTEQEALAHLLDGSVVDAEDEEPIPEPESSTK